MSQRYEKNVRVADEQMKKASNTHIFRCISTYFITFAVVMQRSDYKNE